jgi:hypothetical protein
MNTTEGRRDALTPDDVMHAINRIEYVNHADLQSLIGAVERLVNRQTWAFMGEVQDHLTDAFSAMDDVFASEAEPQSRFTQGDADSLFDLPAFPSIRRAA